MRADPLTSFYVFIKWARLEAANLHFERCPSPSKIIYTMLYTFFIGGKMAEKSVVITYETLFELLNRERERPELQKLEQSFFADVVDYLREKRISKRKSSSFPKRCRNCRSYKAGMVCPCSAEVCRHRA